MRLVVSKNSEDGFSNIQDAIDAANSGDTIIIEAGRYEERLEVKTPGIDIIGENSNNTIISFSLYANEIMEDGMKRGTFRTATAFIDANDISVSNVTFVNESGDGREVGQAIAMYAEGDHIHFKNCRFIGHQDTLFTGPLPPKENSHRGFIGPKENSPRINGRQWYENCYIEGDVDFIFGSATAVFTDCKICSLNRNMDPNGYVTAPSTPIGQEYGYIFINCDFINEGCTDNSVYLSRPWREYAKCVFIGCSYDKHIKSEGFHDWNKEIAHDTSYYAEYPGIDGRCDWAHSISEEESKEYTVERIYLGVV